MNPALAGCLGIAGELELLEHLVHEESHLAHLWPLYARNRIQVHAQLVRMIEIFGSHGMRMELQACQIGEPRERGSVARYHLVGTAPRREADRDDLDPLRPGFGRPLLIEELVRDAIGIAHEHVGPAARSAQSAGSHREVVLHEVELGVTRLRKEHLARIGYRYFAVSCDHDFVRGFHGVPPLRRAAFRGLNERKPIGVWRTARQCTGEASGLRSGDTAPLVQKSHQKVGDEEINRKPKRTNDDPAKNREVVNVPSFALEYR